MKNIIIILIASLSFSACQSSGNKNAEKIKTNLATVKDSLSSNTIQVYYFHGSIRCETCVAVDQKTQQYLLDLFPGKIKNGKIIFQSINIDKNERPDLIQKYKIYGQTLLIIKGNKVIDATDDAFMLVPAKPDKWRQKLKDKVQQLIK